MIDAFEQLMELQESEIRLDCAALHLARDAYPDLDLHRHLSRLDALADMVSERRPGIGAVARFEAMRDVLVGEENFTGNTQDYFDPQNSYLNRVLDRRVGIPISLSVIWTEVGRRLKWPVAGVGFPGHFLVRFDDPDCFVLADPFRDGMTLSLEDCKERLSNQGIDESCFQMSMLEGIHTRAILSRMLKNLRTIFEHDEDYARLARVLRRLMMVEPEESRHVQDLAELLCKMGHVGMAYYSLAGFLQQRPDCEDSTNIEKSMQRMRAMMTSRN
ncbi:MAG: transglutaminase family protein [Phycisphaerales bacterium]|nr:transglutaminase family protein [Phycisphaerales bacterium]